MLELLFEVRRELTDLPKFLKAKSIRCSKCDGLMHAEHFSRKNIDSIEERLLMIFSGEARVQPFKRMVTCAVCSDAGKTSVMSAMACKEGQRAMADAEAAFVASR